MNFFPTSPLSSLKVAGVSLVALGIFTFVTESSATATPTLPTIPNAIVPLGGKGLVVNLNKYIPFPLPQGSTKTSSSNNVLVSSSEGSFVIQLFPTNAPATVANFLRYVTNGLYNNMIIDRVTTNFFQTGGYLDANNLAAITNFSPVINEAGLSNVKGTLATLLDQTNPDSATSQWFINTTNNSSLYDKGQTTNGNPPPTVFGQVLGTNGMAFVDTISKITTYNLSGLGAQFQQVPLVGWGGGTLYYSDFVTINKMQQVALPVATATSSDTNSFTTSIQGNNLIVKPVAPNTAPVTISIIAADTNGSASYLSFQVSTGKLPQSINFPVTEINYSTNGYNFYSTGATTSSGLNFSTLSIKSGPASFKGLLYFKSPGVVTATVFQSGNLFYYPASATGFIIVDRAPQILTSFPSIANQTNVTIPYQLTLSNLPTSSAGLPVSITTVGSVKLTGMSLLISGAGTVTLTAKQPGNANYYSATPVTTSFTVTPKQ